MKFNNYTIVDAAGVRVDGETYPTRKIAQQKLDHLLITAGPECGLTVAGIGDHGYHPIPALCDMCESAGIAKEATITRIVTEHLCETCASFVDAPDKVSDADSIGPIAC